MRRFATLTCLTLAAVLFAAGLTYAEQPSKADAAAFDVFRNLVKEQPGKNIVYSPFSLRQAMQLAYVGADKKTAKEIDALFGYADEKPAAEETKAEGVATEKPEDEESPDAKIPPRFTTANSVWIQPGYVVKKSYKEAVEKLGAEVDKLDSAESVNKWVSRKTEGKISKLMEEPLDVTIRVALLNAVYFRGSWKVQFDENLTIPKPFRNIDGSQGKVSMMRNDMRKEGAEIYGGQKKDYAYAKLHYEENSSDGSSFSMTIILPNKGVKFANFCTKFDAAEWLSLLHDEDSAKTQKAIRKIEKLEMPKFKTESDFDLIPALKANGINDAFGDADFSKLADYAKMPDKDNLFICVVQQKVFLDVHEKGTEAAAVTVVAGTDGIPPKTMKFIVDRPFLYILSGNVDGKEHILFMGSYVKAPK